MSVRETLQVSEGGSLTRSREHVKRHRSLFAVLVVLTFGAPFLGLVVAGISGVVVGLVVSAITWFMGPYAAERVIERWTRDF